MFGFDERLAFSITRLTVVEDCRRKCERLYDGWYAISAIYALAGHTLPHASYLQLCIVYELH